MARIAPHPARRGITRLALVAVLAFLVSAAPALAAPSSVPDTTYVTNGTVDAIARSGNTIYLGGQFSEIGPRTGPLASIDPSSGAFDSALPQVSGRGATIDAVVGDGHGGEYIGGSFTHVGGLPHSNLAHILANDSVDPTWNPSANSTVYALAISGSTVYIGGRFSGANSINGTLTRNHLAAVDATSGTATAWDPNASGTVNALAISASTVYIGGAFSGANSINGTQERNNLAAVDATSGTATAWNPNASGTVDALTISGSTVYIGGAFRGANSINGTQTRNHLAAVGATSGTATAWDPNANNTVYALAISAGTVYVGGEFVGANSINGTQERNYLAAVDATSGTATAWDPNANGTVYALAISGSTVYIGGEFSGANSINGSLERNYLAAVDATSGTATAWNPNANEDVYALAISGAGVIAGGEFDSLGGHHRNHLAAVDATSGTATAWDPNASGTVDALTISGSTVYIGGEFSGANSINGSLERNYLAAVDATSGTATAWNPNASDSVRALAASGGTVYIGGRFEGPNAINGTLERNNLAAVDATSGTATAWNPNASGTVNALAISGSTVYIGGEFRGPNSINGSLERNYLAAVDATSGTATSWDPNASGGVGALAISGSTVYIGGYFSGANSINGSLERNYLAAVDATSGMATAWNPNASNSVYTLSVSGGTVYLGGRFEGTNSINGSLERNHLAAVDATSGTATAWNPNANRNVYTLFAAPDGSIYAGGAFTSLDLAPQANFASFSEPPVNTALPQITGSAQVGQTLSCSTGAWSGSMPQSYTYQWLRNGGAITGVTSAQYVVTAADVGQQLACAVTASNLSGTRASATSAAVSATAAPPAPTPPSTPLPTTPLPTTPLPPTPLPPTPLAPLAPRSAFASVGNQRITLSTPSLLVCTASTKTLAVTLASETIAGSKGVKLKFKSAAFYIGKGVKHVHSKTTGRRGKGKRVLVSVYLPNATARHVPVTLDLPLAGLKSGTSTLRVTVTFTYRKTERRHNHKVTVGATQSKTLTATFRVC